MANTNYSYLNADTLIVFVGFIIVLLVLFTIIKDVRKMKQVSLEKQMEAKKVPSCPDYWESVGESKCRNIHKLGKCGHKQDVDFSDNIFTDKRTGKIMKCRYAKECEISWEGTDKIC